jgi:2-dehydropantoate 2-reductase
MRILILGAGATGGYFGGRLAQAGGDVSFLVRERRRHQLARDGLTIESQLGNFTGPVTAVTREALAGPYDAVILSAKAYDLTSAIDAIRAGVGPSTVVLPLLNGLKHLDDLDRAFGAERVLGGTCHLSVVLGENGVIRHLNSFASATLGPRFPNQSDAATRLHAELARAFDAKFAPDVLAAMWEKWLFITALAASTCLMRATVGEINRTADGPKFMSGLVDECEAVASANGYPPRPDSIAFARPALTDPASLIAASMLRDIERGGLIEADQIVGDFISRGRERGVSTPLLDVAYVNLQAYGNHRDA